MTERQITEAKRSLPRLYKDYTKEMLTLDKELSCRKMINSILTYHGEGGLFDSDRLMNRYLRDEGNYYGIGERRILELIEEQKTDFAKARVYRNVFRDSDGCPYNSVVWGDEEEE